MESDDIFAQRLVEYRKAAGLKQKDVSNLTGISCASLSHWECGITKPSTDQFVVLFTLYNDRLSRLYPEYAPVTILPPLQTGEGKNAEEIGLLRKELEALNGHANKFLEIMVEMDRK